MYLRTCTYGKLGEFVNYTELLRSIHFGLSGELSPLCVYEPGQLFEPSAQHEKPLQSVGAEPVGNSFTTPGIRCYQTTVDVLGLECELEACFVTGTDTDDNQGVCFFGEVTFCGVELPRTEWICPAASFGSVDPEDSTQEVNSELSCSTGGPSTSSRRLKSCSNWFSKLLTRRPRPHPGLPEQTVQSLCALPRAPAVGFTFPQMDALNLFVPARHI